MTQPTTNNSLVLRSTTVHDLMPTDNRASDWELKVSHALNESHLEAGAAFSFGLRRAVLFGAQLTWVKFEGEKNNCIKKSTFSDWLQKNCPAIQWSTAKRWMDVAEGVLNFFHLRHSKMSCSLKDILTLPATDLNKHDAKLQSQILELIDGKTQAQLQILFRRQAEARKFTPPKPLTIEQSQKSEREGAEMSIKELMGKIGSEVLIDGICAITLVTRETQEALLKQGEAMNRKLRDILKPAARKPKKKARKSRRKLLTAATQEGAAQ